MPLRRNSQAERELSPALAASAALALVAPFIALAGCSKGSPNGPPTTLTSALVGIAANPTDATYPDSVGSAILTARALGANFFQMGDLWSTLEPAPGAVNLAGLNATLGQLEAIGLTPYYNLRVIDTNQRGLPADIASRPFDDPVVVARADAIVDTLIGVFRLHTLAAFSFGNEVDAYLGARPSEVSAFRALLVREVGRIHARLPSLAVGCCTQSPPQNAFAWVGDTLNRFTDVAIYTYYPFQPGLDFVHRPTSSFEPDLAAMIARNPAIPIGLQEVGYSSSSVNGSSPAAQADFVRRFRRYVATAPRSRVAFASWFLMTDWSSSTLNALFAYYGFLTPGFSEFLGNLGLRDSVGVPKPAWAAWRNP